jgi:trimeric autotransporter adhesin
MKKKISSLINYKVLPICLVLLLVLNHRVNAQNASYNLNSIPISGANNSAFGYRALFSNNSSTTECSAFGHKALYSNTSGASNNAFGFRSLYSNTSGNLNYALGNGSLEFNTTGSYNVGIGNLSLNKNTTAFGNVGIGTQSLFSNTIGEYNTGIGQTTLAVNTTGNNNVAIGKNTLFNNISGSYNTANGTHSLLQNITGSFNSTLGYASDVGSSNLTNATAIGYSAIVTNSNSMQLGNSSITTVYAGTGINAKIITGGVQVVGGSPGIGKVLTSDAVGNATWQPAGAGGGGSDWSLTGNAGTLDGTNFIGTTDNVPFNIRVNNQKAGRIDPSSLNTFYGFTAGNSNTTGISNSAFGFQALFSNTTGVHNIALGAYSLSNNSTGSQNTAIGSNSLTSNTTGTSNTAVGIGSLSQNTSGFYNTGFGQSTLGSNTTGGYNSALGLSALFLNTTGSYNTANGLYAMVSNTTGNYNASNGYYSLYSNTTGSNNLAIGAYADVASGALTNASAIGSGAIVNNSNSIQLGNSSITSVYAGTGINATLITGGLQVTGGSPGIGKVLTSDAVGNATWQPAGGGGGGNWSLTGNAGTIDGTNFIGTTDNVPFNIRVNNQKAGRIDPTLDNTFYGIKTGLNNLTGRSNTATGWQALQDNTIGNYNTAHGGQALEKNITGIQNTAFGYGASLFSTDGSDNCAIGAAALILNETGSFNTAVGSTAFKSNTKGDYNSALGYGTDVSSSSLTNTTAIGALAIVDASNKIRLGDANVTLVEGPMYVTTSDGRFKNNISEADVKGLEFINRLRPVVYNFDTKQFQDFLTSKIPDSIRGKYFLGKNFKASTSIRQSGFIAQEVEEAAIQSGYSFNGVHKPESENGYYGLAYSQFVVPLVKSVQELSKQNKAMQQTIDEQRSTNELLRKDIEELRSLIKNELVASKQGSIKIETVETEAKLFQNAPNPFNKSTIIQYSVPSNAKKAALIIASLGGEKIMEFNLLTNNGQSIEIEGGKLQSGIYIYSLLINNSVIDSKKMVLTR